MAEITTKNKRSTRVDLTPMVDLGFLLITFFVFTTAMTRPTAMKLILPKDSPDLTLAKESAVITLIPSKNNLIYYYECADPSRTKAADFKSILYIILDKKRRTDPQWFESILKPALDANYKNIGDILDEMKIDAVPHYALVNITPEEANFIKTIQ